METTISAPAPTTPATKTKRYYQDLPSFSSTNTVALTNALLPDVLPLLVKRGYTKAGIEAKLADFALLKTLDEKQRKEYGEQYDATNNYHLLEDSLHEDYADHISLARLVFKKDPAAKTALGLTGTRSVSAGGYCSQALQFYNNALGSEAFKTALATKGITADELTAMKTGFDKLTPLAAKQQSETSEAQAATKARDAKWDELAEWMSDFKATAIIALRKYPQLREKLGYVEE